MAWDPWKTKKTTTTRMVATRARHRGGPAGKQAVGFASQTTTSRTTTRLGALVALGTGDEVIRPLRRHDGVT
jgi:hypothetical protein